MNLMLEIMIVCLLAGCIAQRRSIATMMGIVAGNLFHLRGTIASIRSLGLREHVAIQAAVWRIGVNLGPREAQKLLRLVCASVLEVHPHPGLLNLAVKYAASASSPPNAKSPREIAAACHKLARDMAKIEEKIHG